MGARKEAKDLLDKFYKIPTDKKYNTIGKQHSKEVVKQCAILSVNNTIKALRTTLGHLELKTLEYQEYLQDIVYWEDVIKEIENYDA